MDYFKLNARKWLVDSYSDIEGIANLRLQAFSLFVDVWKPVSVLDIGCGDGRFLNSIDQVHRRVGIDSSRQMLEICRENITDVQFITGDLEDSTFTASLKSLGKFELITMQGVLHYLQSPLESLSPLRHVSGASTIFLLNFRNRLFNLNSRSHYYNSPINVATKDNLLKEISFWKEMLEKNMKFDWTNIIKKNIKFDESFWTAVNAFGINPETLDSNGITDNFWNPDNLSVWKQFTPLEILALLKKVGFQAIDFLTIRGNYDDLVTGYNSSSMIEESSFIVAASRKVD
jgi:SAM-dependent methyltransferase